LTKNLDTPEEIPAFHDHISRPFLVTQPSGWIELVMLKPVYPKWPIKHDGSFPKKKSPSHVPLSFIFRFPDGNLFPLSRGGNPFASPFRKGSQIFHLRCYGNSYLQKCKEEFRFLIQIPVLPNIFDQNFQFL